jgi:hypothetical protein
MSVLTIGKSVPVWRVSLRDCIKRQSDSQVFQSSNLLQPKSKRTNRMQSYEKNDPNRARLVVDDQGQEITNEENQETDQRGPGRFAEQGSKEKRKANNGKECELPEDKKQQRRGPLVKLRADKSGTAEVTT